MTDRDLFGAEVVAAKPVREQVHGYASAPGHGPAGEKCKTCRYATPHGHGSKTYCKCALVKATGGPGTDIRLKSPACRRWEAPE